MASKLLFLHTDGASRGNPGQAAIGVIIHDEDGHKVATISERLPDCTNNQAEYRAIIAGLEKALEMGATGIILRSDSELAVQQLQSKYRVKNEGLKPLFNQAMELRRRFVSFDVAYIPREQNREADALANRALDGPDMPPASKSPIHVRRAAREDYPSMSEIFCELEKQHVEAVPEFFKTMSREEQFKEFDETLANENAVILVAERDGEVLGYIQMELKESENHPMLRRRRFVKINDLGVARRFWRSGAGSVLMSAAERWAAEKGIGCLELNVWEFNSGALAFYDKMGYSTAGRMLWKFL